MHTVFDGIVYQVPLKKLCEFCHMFFQRSNAGAQPLPKAGAT
jgi:hypothetical protein